MSLVAYASSGSDSENEETTTDDIPVNVPKNKDAETEQSTTEEIPVNVPKTRDLENEESTAGDMPVNVPKKREPVKISIPSLKEFKDESDPDAVKKPKPKSGSGLFSLLPPPKNSSSISSKPGFTPYVFSKKKEPNSVPKPSHKKQLKPSAVINPTESASSNIDEIEDTNECTDFFSLGNTSTTETSSFEETPSFVTSVTSSPYETDGTMASASSSLLQTSSIARNYVENNTDTDSSTNYISENNNYADSNFDQFGNNISEPTKPNDLFNDEQFLKLAGRHRKEEINFIDVKADDQIVGNEELIMKSLTEEKIHRPLKRSHDMPTSQQKRKHQITYLAFQAKQREMDLKNQWAMNSLTKRETQAKYGF